MYYKQRIGKEGERLALEHIRSIGYCIRGCNVRMGYDEIDIIAWDPQDRALVFIEVKTFGRRPKEAHPSHNFSWKKKKRTIRAARKWVAKYGYTGGFRVDLVCVIGTRIVDHVKEVNGF